MTPSDKGLLGGSCNRSACLAPNAYWYNHSTQAHYCDICAEMINQANLADALKLYGHDLCTLVIPDWKNKSVIAVETGDRIMFTIADEVLDPFVFGKNLFDNFMIGNSEDVDRHRLKVVCEFLHGPNDRYLIHAKDDYQRTGLPSANTTYLLKNNGEWLNRKLGHFLTDPSVWCVVNECFVDENCGNNF